MPSMREFVSRLVLTAIVITSCVQAQIQQVPKPCPDIAGLMVPQFVMNIPTSELERVELRKCGPGVSETLQIVAWTRRTASPTLVVDTTDFTVIQSVMCGRVFVIETTGGPRDQVYVIVYEAGKPKLALHRVTKARAEIATTGRSVQVSVPNTRTGKTENFSFPRE